MLRRTGPWFNAIPTGRLWGTGVLLLARKRQRTAAVQDASRTRERVGLLRGSLERLERPAAFG